MSVNQVTPVVTTQPGAQGQLVPGLVPTQAAMYNMGAAAGGQEPPAVWMPKPTGGLGCPAGLEYLTQVDRMTIKQQANLMEMMSRVERPNEYNILNSAGQQIYKANEESDSCHRTCCRANRGFVMHVTDNISNEVIRMERVFRCFSYPCFFSCIDCCAHRVNVEAPVGTAIGHIKQKASCGAPQFGVYDADDNELLVIAGPSCICPQCCPDVEFVIHSGDSEVGKISKLAPQDMMEMFSTADSFTVSFQMSLDAKVKALLFGATFLIDFLYFELPPTRRGGGRGGRRRRR